MQTALSRISTLFTSEAESLACIRRRASEDNLEDPFKCIRVDKCGEEKGSQVHDNNHACTADNGNFSALGHLLQQRDTPRIRHVRLRILFTGSLNVPPILL